MTEHSLKTMPIYWQPLFHGAKQFEIRRNDRGFSVGDILHLREWEPQREQYTGREARFRVTYILFDHFPGLAKDFCAMSLAKLEGKP